MQRLSVAIFLVLCFGSATHAQNQATSLRPAITSGSAPRSFVSSQGLDTNPCTRTAPCRSFDAAIAQTAPGGVVTALDSAGYGKVTIGNSITLMAPEGVYAALTAGALDFAVFIHLTAATDVVVLRGLSIEGLGAGERGISLVDHLNVLRVQKCRFSGLTQFGIDFEPTNAGTLLDVSDTSIEDTPGTALRVFANPGFNPIVQIDHVSATNVGTGLSIQQAVALISNSTVAGASLTGIVAGAGTTRVTVDHCRVAGALTALTSSVGAQMWLSNSVIANNSTALDLEGGSIFTLIGDANFPVKTNVFTNNGTMGSFSATLVAQ